MKLRRQEIDVAQNQMQTGKNTATKMYFFDPIDLFKTVLSSPSFQTKLHIGMAEFVDSPSQP